MAETKAILDEGIGVALVDRLPMDRLTAEQATAAHWVLGQMVGMPVAQKWDGTMIYDVTDTGRRAAYGVRGSWTNLELLVPHRQLVRGGAAGLRRRCAAWSPRARAG